MYSLLETLLNVRYYFRKSGNHKSEVVQLVVGNRSKLVAVDNKKEI